MFCFNEFAFTVQVKHKINSIQILGFILICLYYTIIYCLQCFDAVGWAAGRASGL